jgi:hypothetical protein
MNPLPPISNQPNDPSPPEPPPSISRKELWSALILPPLAVVLMNWVAAQIYKEPIGAFFAFTLPVGALFILMMTLWFVCIIRPRFTGASFVFLCLGYLLGEVVICLSLWSGTCLAWGRMYF